MSQYHRKFTGVGPGGRKCPCCFPRAGTVDYRKTLRCAKLRARREAMRIERREYDGNFKL